MSRFLLVCMLSAGCQESPPGQTSPKSVQRAVLPDAGTDVDSSAELVNSQNQNVQPKDWFEDVTGQCGVNFTYHNGAESGHRFILESLGGGVAMIDYDVDGDLDLYFTGGGSISADPVQISGRRSGLFRNDGHCTFTDVTEDCQLDGPVDYSHGVAVADFDRDGYPDLFVCCYGTSRLYRNVQGTTFEDVTEAANLGTEGWCTSAAWTDFDANGLPDLVVVRYLDWSPDTDQICFHANGQQEVCGPGRFAAQSDLCFRNRGDGKFENVSEQMGFSDSGKGLGVVAADLNLDGHIDYYVANDETENHLYLGETDGVRENGFQAGVAFNEYGMHDGSMGAAVGDVNADGFPDLWVTNFESEDNALYLNLGQATFTHATATMSLAGRSRRQVGFGTALADFNGDGWLDIFVANGHVFYHGGQLPYLQQPQLFVNLREGRFQEVTETAGNYFRSSHCGRGAAVGDLDNDGGLDLVIVHQNEPVSVLRNRFPMQHCLRLKLTGQSATREAVGATVRFQSAEQTWTRFVCSGAGYFSHSDQRILLPVPDAGPAEVSVDWPAGGQEIFRGITPGITHELVQGRGIPSATQ